MEAYSKVATPVSVHKNWNYGPTTIFHILLEQIQVPLLTFEDTTVLFKRGVPKFDPDLGKGLSLCFSKVLLDDSQRGRLSGSSTFAFI